MRIDPYIRTGVLHPWRLNAYYLRFWIRSGYPLVLWRVLLLGSGSPPAVSISTQHRILLVLSASATNHERRVLGGSWTCSDSVRSSAPKIDHHHGSAPCRGCGRVEEGRDSPIPLRTGLDETAGCDELAYRRSGTDPDWFQALVQGVLAVLNPSASTVMRSSGPGG